MAGRIDLGPCTAIRHDGSPERCAVLLPGMVYPTRAPVLWFAREAAMALGYSALEVLGDPVEHADKLGWVRDCSETAIAESGSARVVVIGKSLASLLAPEVSDRNLPAAWLTPPLTEPSMIEALGCVRNPTLLVGGTADPMWKAHSGSVVRSSRYRKGDVAMVVVRPDGAPTRYWSRCSQPVSASVI
jgi:hypothetical protein